MTQPCFLVVDREHAGNISTRRLVIETAKLNVITAYSGAEAIETLERFPNVDGAVIDAAIWDISCELLVKRMKDLRPALVIVVIGTPHASDCVGADRFLESFTPGKLLEALQELVPETARIVGT